MAWSLWKRTWLAPLERLRSLVNASVADYGIGGGWLGVVLLQEYRVHFYVGIDISSRQLGVAARNLKGANYTPRTHFSLHLLPPEGAPEFSLLMPALDVFVCQAVIQHFPSRSYTMEWLANLDLDLDRSGIPTLMLQTRFSATPRFNDWGVRGLANSSATATQTGKRGGATGMTMTQMVKYATAFDSDFILSVLKHYQLTWASAIEEQSQYVFYVFTRKSGLGLGRTARLARQEQGDPAAVDAASSQGGGSRSALRWSEHVVMRSR